MNFAALKITGLDRWNSIRCRAARSVRRCSPDRIPDHTIPKALNPSPFSVHVPFASIYLLSSVSVTNLYGNTTLFVENWKNTLDEMALA
jgi:hypothetical protein